MTTSVAVTEKTSDLDALLSALDLDEPEVKKVEVAEIGEVELEAAVRGAETSEAISAAYEHEANAERLLAEEALIDPMKNPEALLSDEPAKPEAAKGKGKGKGKGGKKCADKPAAEKKEPKEKKAATPRKHYSSKTERVTDKFGASLGEYTVLELADAALEGDALAAKQVETMTTLKESGVKVQNRIVFLMEYAAGKSAKLNDIAATALKLLKTDGKIVTGEHGNLHLALVKKYAKSSANAMGNNTVGAMKALKMIVAGEKQEYVANPNSLYLAKINALLSI